MIDVSLIITNYNYAQYLVECIDSCINQEPTTLKYEIIVVDDGSTDGSVEIVNRYSNCFLITIANSGVEVAANKAFLNASGEYIVRVDADDILSTSFFSTICFHASL